MKDYIPRIRIEDKHRIQVLVCHLIYSIGCPLTRDQLIEITSLEQAVNYFDLIDALDSITDRLCVCEEINGMPVYSNTSLGVEAARQLGGDLPASVREKMFEETVKVYTRDAIRRDSLVAVRYAEHDNGTCTVGITIKSEKTGRAKYYLSAAAENREQADKIKKRVQSDPERFRKYLEDFFEPSET